MKRGKDPVIVERFTFAPVALRAVAHQTGQPATRETLRAFVRKTVDATIEQVIAAYYDRETPAVRQTACKHCGQDIEGIAPFVVGEWRDRGNNTHCPTPAGDAGQLHAPVQE